MVAGFFKSLAPLILIFWLGGCASVPSPEQRYSAAENMLEQKGWSRLNIDAPPFVLRAYLPGKSVNEALSGGDKILTVYLEGDGYAWRTRSSPSADPTPIDPVGLRLALRHPGGRVAYLARPCQFVSLEGSSDCEEAFWTTHRFSQEVIDSSSFALSALLEKTASSALRLVGYSGGAAVAALVAASRDDVVQLISIAGNLDHEEWTKFHSVSPLAGSLNPIEFTQQLQSLPQIHLVGGDDKIIPPLIAGNYQEKFPVNQQPVVQIFQDYTHRCCWVEDWPEIYSRLIRGKYDGVRSVGR